MSKPTLMLTLCMLFGLSTTVSVAAPKSESIDNALSDCASAFSSSRRILPNTDHRIGVFAFEDPHETGLANVAASVFAREVLITASASRIGVVYFSEDLSPASNQAERYTNDISGVLSQSQAPSAQPLSYFDKVEEISSCQELVLALWGIIKRTAAGVSIEAYVQVPENSAANRYFSIEIDLGDDQIVDALKARVQPDRMKIYKSELLTSDIERLQHAALTMNRLLKSPPKAQPYDTLPFESVYYVVDKNESWVHLSGSGKSGWIPRKLCEGACGGFLRAANFTGKVLQFLADGYLPSFDSRYGIEAAAVAAQLKILDSLRLDSTEALQRARQHADCWLDNLGNAECKNEGYGSVTPGDILPGGAALANLRAIVAAKQLFDSHPNSPQEEMQKALKPIVQNLAQASQYDPHNFYVLHNLSILFDYLGDTSRATLAKNLANKYSSNEQAQW